MPPRLSVAAVGFAVTWTAYFGVLQWSVVRYRAAIVLVLLGAALALAHWLWWRSRVELDRSSTAVALGDPQSS